MAAAAKIEGYCKIAGKKYVMFTDRSCLPGEVKLTDGFHDKSILRLCGKIPENCMLDKKEADVERITRRLRGTRPWHPLLKLLKREVEK